MNRLQFVVDRARHRLQRNEKLIIAKTVYNVVKHSIINTVWFTRGYRAKRVVFVVLIYFIYGLTLSLDFIKTTVCILFSVQPIILFFFYFSVFVIL